MVPAPPSRVPVRPAAVVVKLKVSLPVPPVRFSKLAKRTLSSLPKFVLEMVQLLVALAHCSVLVPLAPLKVVATVGTGLSRVRVSLVLPMALRADNEA